MNAVIDYINENEQDLGNGYKKLRALCKLWLFTNNGVKFIGDPSFNLVKSARNLGVKFIGSRIADEDLVDNNFTLKNLILQDSGNHYAVKLILDLKQYILVL